jgi:hypothetical protein
VLICWKLVKAIEFPPDIYDRCKREKRWQNLGLSEQQKDTGLRCGGRGKSEITPALRMCSLL